MPCAVLGLDASCEELSNAAENLFLLHIFFMGTRKPDHYGGRVSSSKNYPWTNGTLNEVIMLHLCNDVGLCNSTSNIVLH